MVIRYAESRNGRSWDVATEPALAVPDDPQAWDATHTETPSVVFDPVAPSDRRFKLYYSGASRMHPSGFPSYQIGVAISADGRTFTRLPAAASPYQRAGLVLRVAGALPDVAGLADGVVADPEVVVIVDGVRHLFYTGWGSRNVPSGFVVPVRDSRQYVPAVLNLLHATRPAAR